MRLSFVILLSLLMVTAYSSTNASDREDWGMPPIDFLADELSLSPDQQTKIDELHFTFETLRITKRSDLNILKLKLHRAMRQEKPDVDEIMKLVDDINGIRSEIMKERVKVKLNLLSILTLDQRKQLDEFRFEGRKKSFPEARRERREERRRGMGRRGFSPNEDMDPPQNPDDEDL